MEAALGSLPSRRSVWSRWGDFPICLQGGRSGPGPRMLPSAPVSRLACPGLHADVHGTKCRATQQGRLPHFAHCRRRRHRPPLPPATATGLAAAACEPAQEAYAEAEADLADAAKKGGGKRRRKAGEPAAAAAAGEAGDDEDAFFSSLSAQGRLPKFVELLKFKVGAAGMRWSCRLQPWWRMASLAAAQPAWAPLTSRPPHLPLPAEPEQGLQAVGRGDRGDAAGAGGVPAARPARPRGVCRGIRLAGGAEQEGGESGCGSCCR